MSDKLPNEVDDTLGELVKLLPNLSKDLDQHLLCPEKLPIHSGEKSLRYFPRIPKPEERLVVAELAPLSTTIKMDRDLATGQITGFREVRVKDAGSTAKNSSSLNRVPGPPGEKTFGNPGNYPFWPGGFTEPELTDDIFRLHEQKLEQSSGILTNLDDPKTYYTCPPGFERGFQVSEHTLSGKKCNWKLSKESENTVINLTEVLARDELSEAIFTEIVKPETTKTESKNNSSKSTDPTFTKINDDGFNPESSGVPEVVLISESQKPKLDSETSTEWAELLDITQPMSDFHTKVPQMAFTWPFELDTFQKQAVLRLERNESIFVAAHTSAGKTVVAEYAIALSQRHMTRTIYTSPIKALSNQKFRDFKDTFKDVGLVTGDIQINPTATCLIMTTEILRSMLYNGSDIIRDLEYVVFDEVHYINDSERGVVWEEVLILLPDHVNIIMLSATVPNVLDFADWVGRTKKKKIYVISTLKRPVPLEHFLYTGSNGLTKDERFLLQDAAGNFLPEGHKKAVNAKKARESKGKQQSGFKGTKDRVGPQQEKNIWLTLIGHLEKNDKLPVVAFTLSKNRCDQNADLLTSLDLTTSMEKGDIHHFIQKCVSRLKGTDRRLPQVMKMIELLKRGIGIHHSGILPILKEVVEMLFQRGFVKLLFATETFAMGVNMPARTVVFDNIRKHDGTKFRTLLPAEYIQMAGRAGRRGLDSTGTVIILCKNEVHELSDLHSMMQGKPMKLESKFRLTYSMILNLLRVEKLRVEDMMKRSFLEIDSQKKAGALKSRLEEVKSELERISNSNAKSLISKNSENEQILERFYSLASEYFEMKDSVWNLLLSHPAAVKLLSPGRILVLRKRDSKQLGILLNVDSKSREKVYSVFVLNEQAQNNSSDEMKKDENNEKLERFLSLISILEPLFGAHSNHQVRNVNDRDIMEITTKSAKIDGEKVLSDIKKREIPRFRNEPPGQNTNSAVQELLNISDASKLEYVNLCRDLKIQEIDLQKTLMDIQNAKDRIQELDVPNLPDFRDQFQKVFRHRSLVEEVKDLEFLSSEASLQNLGEYHQRIEVLKLLNCIDENNTVKLKGRVACEMGSQELMITELVLDNVLTDLPPAEIAALLSCMVFQQKNCSEPELTPRLEEGIKKIKQCAEMIGTKQKECGMLQPVQDYVDQFHFGLVQVVYEWARGMPFSEITQLTDVQEGIIVRTIQRLDESVRDVKDAARVIGDSMLYQKMDETSTIIKRDIVFAASLYTQ